MCTSLEVAPSGDYISVILMIIFFKLCFFSPQVMIWAHLQLRLQTSLRGCLSSQGKICVYEGKDENLSKDN